MQQGNIAIEMQTTCHSRRHYISRTRLVSSKKTCHRGIWNRDADHLRCHYISRTRLVSSKKTCHRGIWNRDADHLSRRHYISRTRLVSSKKTCHRGIWNRDADHLRCHYISRTRLVSSKKTCHRGIWNRDADHLSVTCRNYLGPRLIGCVIGYPDWSGWLTHKNIQDVTKLSTRSWSCTYKLNSIRLTEASTAIHLWVRLQCCTLNTAFVRLLIINFWLSHHYPRSVRTTAQEKLADLCRQTRSII
ncbi:hypothetical protein J6590_056669 [Homalodisca vitripennis]|nr:hypothetical protein J6590_056669 [Homalodisca vitripennis]